MPELSVVIPTYRRRAELSRALAALGRQTVAPDRFEVIVVDDPVDDDPSAVAAVVAAAGAPVRHLHRERSGVSAARNTGWRAALAPVVLFLGDDILADQGLVAAHLSFHAENPGEQQALLGNVRWADELRRTPFMAWLERGIQSNYGRLDTGEAPSWGDFITTNISVKRALVERGGGFDEENFPFLYEDTDLGLRLAALGMQLRYSQAARAEHLHAPRLAEWRSRMKGTAAAERRWASLHADAEPYFEPRLRAAAEVSRTRAALAHALAAAAHLGVPHGGQLMQRALHLHFRRRLAREFLQVWDSDAAW